MAQVTAKVPLSLPEHRLGAYMHCSSASNHEASRKRLSSADDRGNAPGPGPEFPQGAGQRQRHQLLSRLIRASNGFGTTSMAIL